MTASKPNQSKFTIRAILGFAIYLFLNPLILFVCAGTARWAAAWAYFGIALLSVVLSRVIAHRKNPGLLEERGRYQDSENVKPWDKILMPVAALYGPLISFIVAGLDHRYGWTNLFPTWSQVAALLVGVLSVSLSTWAMVSNPFFSAVVRIQEDRAHTVCKSGPYRYVRHPGYAGGVLWYLITPVVFDSLWAMIPIAIATAATVARTALEDKTLREELPGYLAYTQETRYRLLPGIW